MLTSMVGVLVGVLEMLSLLSLSQLVFEVEVTLPLLVVESVVEVRG
jgi:prepilin signal peptidase PulO-like enzyme (type II secretory pathway)